MKGALFAAVIMLILLCGCAGIPGLPDADTGVAAGPEVTQGGGLPDGGKVVPAEGIAEDAKTEIELPLAFTYTVPMYKEEGVKLDRHIVYYLEKEIKCGGRDAIAGAMSSYDEDESAEHTQWAKFTLYLDNGEFGSSGWMNKSGLAFDDAVPGKTGQTLLTQLNSIFAGSGKNLNSQEIWESDIPTLLKNVYYQGSSFGDITGDLSVIKKGASSAYTKPCTEFSVNVKSSNGFNGEIVYCITGTDSEIGLPYSVSISTPQMKNSNNTELKKVEKKASGAPLYPQCMESVGCEAPKFMTNEEREACKSAGKRVQELRDKEGGCITAYECLSDQEAVRMNIIKSQPEQCQEPSSELIQKVIKCLEKVQGDKITPQYDNQGCIVSVEC
ncbi:MAG: hypothetical protein ABH854_03045 [Candidatus Diapherotrites archaeon]